MIPIVSYYSPDYYDYAKRLIESLDKWGIPQTERLIEPVKPFKSWKEGVSSKPEFLRRILALFSNEPGVLWVDADAYAVAPIPFDQLLGDFSATLFQWSQHHAMEILTGTMYLRNCPPVHAMLDEWIRTVGNFSYSDTPEQEALKPLINQVIFSPLPMPWTFIDDDLVREQYPDVKPIFIHTQASRKIRREEAIHDQKKA